MQVLRVLQHPAGDLERLGAGPSQPVYPLSAAPEYRDFQLILQRLDMAAYARLGRVQRRSRAPHVEAAIDDRAKEFELLEVHGKYLVSA